MRRLFMGATVAAIVAGAGAASASTLPKPGPVDPRVAFFTYDSNQVYSLSATFRHALQIQFNDSETITQAALGDTVSWEIVPVGNILFVKPREKGRPTNLIVLTNYLGSRRSYRFDLAIASGPKVYAVKFRYPAEESQKAIDMALLMARERTAAVENKVVNDALDHSVIEGKRNLDYWVRGASELQPSEISDNGEFTALRYPGHADIPSIFGINPDGTETIIPYDVREDFVVLHGVWRELRLRRGLSLLCISNRGAPRNERTVRTGTVSPAIERKVRGGRP